MSLQTIELLSPVYVTFFWSAVFLLGAGKNRRSRIGLGIFMMLAFILYVCHAVYFSRNFLLYSYLDGIYILSTLSVYPVYYLYVRFLSTGKPFEMAQLSHFIPALLFGFTTIFFYSRLNMQERISQAENPQLGINSENLSHSILYISSVMTRIILAMQVVSYLFMISRLLKEHEDQVNELFSNTERFKLNWVNRLTIIMVLMALTSIALAIAGRGFFVGNPEALIIPSVLTTVLLFSFGYIGNEQTTEFYFNELNSEESKMAVSSNQGYELVKTRFEKFLSEKKPYLNADLKIWDLCRDLNTNRTYISRVINEEYGMNFCSFINHKRVEEAKKLLTDKEHDNYSLEAIAELSGFGSINSFQRAFKDFENSTPGKYRMSQTIS